MHWQDILVILVPIMSLMGWIYNRLEKRFEKIDQRFERFEQKFDERFSRVDEKLQILDSRISRIEGQLAPRIWEPQIIEKKKEE